MKYLLLFILLPISSMLQGQEDLSQIIAARDSLIFERAFNNCETAVLEKIIYEDAEFYHDQVGITKGKEAFINNVKNGLCSNQMPYKPIRVLDKHTIFPLYNNGVLYGIIQRGKHSFYAKEEGKEMYFTSQADFNHLWLLENDEWKLKQVLSYNHVTDKKEIKE